MVDNEDIKSKMTLRDLKKLRKVLRKNRHQQHRKTLVKIKIAHKQKEHFDMVNIQSNNKLIKFLQKAIPS